MPIWIEQPTKMRFYSGLSSGEIDGFTNASSLKTYFPTEQEAIECLDIIRKRSNLLKAFIVKSYEKQRSFTLLIPGMIQVILPQKYDPLFVSKYDSRMNTPVVDFTYDAANAKIFSLDDDFIENDLPDIEILISNQFAETNDDLDGLVFPEVELILSSSL